VAGPAAPDDRRRLMRLDPPEARVQPMHQASTGLRPPPEASLLMRV